MIFSITNEFYNIYNYLIACPEGPPEIQSHSVFHWGHTLRAPDLLHDCSLFMIYLIAVSLTVAPLGL